MSSPNHSVRGTRSAARPAASRRGVTVILVLLLLAVTLGLSYSLVRTQSMSVAIQQNADLRALAHQAAITGLTMGMKRMQTNSWEGVEIVYSRPLDASTGFHVEYRTGDAALNIGDPDYGEYPFRVTVVSTGYAADPADPARVAEHRVEAVVQLVPRALATEPSGWSDIAEHTVCQYTPGDCRIDMPVRIEGVSRWRGTLELGLGLYWSSDARWWYFDGLRQMRIAGQPDCRPFNSDVRMYYWSQYSDTWSVMQTPLGVTPVSKSNTTSFAPSLPSVTGYRLYTGGKLYGATTVSATLNGVTLEPDPINNPLGIFLRAGRLELQQNVTIRGSLATTGGADSDIEITGAGVRITPVELPALCGASPALPIRLPTVLSADDIRLQPGAGWTVSGVVMAPDDFEVRPAAQSATTLVIEGHLVARDIYIHPREDWAYSSIWWQTRFMEFYAQRSIAGGIPYWPQWLEKRYNLRAAPQLVFKPDASAAYYHWPASDAVVFVAHAGDGGLRWELIRWTENP